MLRVDDSFPSPAGGDERAVLRGRMIEAGNVVALW